MEGKGRRKGRRGKGTAEKGTGRESCAPSPSQIPGSALARWLGVSMLYTSNTHDDTHLPPSSAIFDPRWSTSGKSWNRPWSDGSKDLRLTRNNLHWRVVKFVGGDWQRSQFSPNLLSTKFAGFLSTNVTLVCVLFDIKFAVFLYD